MNLARARVVPRPRTAADILDVGALFCARSARLYAPLALGLALPAALGAYLLQARAGWDGWTLWPLCIVAAGLLHGPFTLAAGEAMFETPSARRAPRILWKLVRRLPAFLLAHLLTRGLLLVCTAAFLIAAPWAALRGMFVHEILLLEGAGPFEAIRRSARFSSGHSNGSIGVWIGLLSAPLAGLLAGELLGDAIVNTLFQFGQPFGALFSDGGSLYAFLGFFLSVPYTASVRFCKYVDLRTRREGWDLQLRFLAIAARMEATVPASTAKPRAASAPATEPPP